MPWSNSRSGKDCEKSMCTPFGRRDTPPKSAGDSIRAMSSKFGELGTGRIASIIGRFYAMDRDQRWERVEQAYELIVQGKADYRAESAIDGLRLAYERGETDEFVKATVIVPNGEAPVTVNDGDLVVFMNFRADRARELTRALNDADFSGFRREVIPKLGGFVTLTEYHREFKFPVAFPPQNVTNSLGEIWRSTVSNNCGWQRPKSTLMSRFSSTAEWKHPFREKPASWCRRPRSRPMT